MKTCKQCHLELPEAEFYSHPQTVDKLMAVCKRCHKQNAINRRVNNIENVLAYDHERNQTQERKDYVSNRIKQDRLLNPQKYKARNWVNNALRDGRIKREPCKLCGNPNAQAHHHNYDDPTNFDWLCFRCHREVHGQLNR